MPKVKTAKRQKVRAREAIVVTVGARPVQYQRRIVRDNRTGQLVEIDMHELPPVDEGAFGTPYAFRRDEEVDADHPAVQQSPHAFVPIEDEAA